MGMFVSTYEIDCDNLLQTIIAGDQRTEIFFKDQIDYTFLFIISNIETFQTNL